MVRRGFAIVGLLFMLFGSVSAQGVSLDLDPDSEIRLEGTSNVRDWGADATSIEANFILSEFTSLADLRPDHFQTLEIRIEAEGLHTDSRRLRRNIHRYLKSDDHPYIIFELSEITSIDYDGDTAHIEAEGRLTAAGETRDIHMQVYAESGDEGLIFTGSHDMLMTDFGIDPPTAALGTIRAADEITVNFNVRFNP